VDSFLEIYSSRSCPEFPITGHDLKDYYFEGQDIKKYLDKLKDLWIESDFVLNKAELLKKLIN
jgi:hypothetical protein